MKRAPWIVATFGLLGVALGGAWGYLIATSEDCQVFSDDPNATCYVLFGDYVSEVIYHAVVEPFQGLVIGLGLGLIVVVGRSMLRRSA